MNERYTRREVVKLTTGLIAATAFPQLAYGKKKKCKGPKDPSQRVIVIGAGMAGLTAAKYLSNSGFDTIVLDGKDYIGGRTHTIDLSGATVDLGAAWIHGPRNHPAAMLAKKSGISYDSHDFLNTYEPFYSKFIDNFLTSDAIKTYLAYANDFNQEVSNIVTALGPQAKARDVIEIYLDSQELTGLDRDHAQLFIELDLTDYAAPIDQFSFYSELMREGNFGVSKGDDQILDGGYKSIIDLLAENLDIRLESNVHRIEYDQAGVHVHTQNEVFQGTHVIVTIPLGVLKTGNIEFSPVLPDSKLNAIDRLDMGNLEKVIFVYNQKFWDTPLDGAWGYGSGLDLAYSQFIDITQFAGKPTIACLYYGQSARTIPNLKTDQEIIAEALSLLSKFIGESAIQPIDTYVTRWVNDPFTLGSYSYLPVGSSQEDHVELAQPVGERILFAGEATHETANGTVNGAMLTGIREAMRLGACPNAITGLNKFARKTKKRIRKSQRKRK